MSLQWEALSRPVEHLTVPGYLVIGADERLPHDVDGFVALPGVPEIYRYVPDLDQG